MLVFGFVMMAWMVPMMVYLHVRTRSPRTRTRVPAVRDEPRTVNLTLSRDGVFR